MKPCIYLVACQKYLSIIYNLDERLAKGKVREEFMNFSLGRVRRAKSTIRSTVSKDNPECAKEEKPREGCEIMSEKLFNKIEIAFLLNVFRK